MNQSYESLKIFVGQCSKDIYHQNGLKEKEKVTFLRVEYLQQITEEYWFGLRLNVKHIFHVQGYMKIFDFFFALNRDKDCI